MSTRRRSSGAGTVRRKGARHWAAYIIAAISGFAAAYLIVVAFIFPPGAPPISTPVPNVVGLTYDEAVNRLSTSGFGAQQGDQHENGAPKLTVLVQTPAATTSTPHGTKIVLDVSSGPPKNPPPDSAEGTVLPDSAKSP